MSDEVKFKWDAEKHEANLPKQPEILNVSCPHCSNEFFLHIQSIQAHLIDSAARLQFNATDAVVCIKCNKVMNVKELKIGRKTFPKPAIVPSPKDTQ